MKMELSEMNKLVLEFEEALLQINRVKAGEIFEKVYKQKNNFGELEELVVRTLEIMGTAWENGDISLAQEYMASIICEELIEKYLPLADIARKDVPKVAIGVLQDNHGLGKRMVYAILRAGGFELLDFGQGLSVEEMCLKTLDSQVEILLVSTLMYSSALQVKELRSMLVEAGASVKIIVGGAPFRLDSELWKTVGADVDGQDASKIIGIIDAMLAKKSEVCG